MYPEKNIPINPMGLSPQSSASMMGSMGGAVNSALPPPEPESPSDLQKVALQFQSAWKAIEDLNGTYGGDSDKFRNVQKALEDWFSDIAQKLPESSAQNSGY